MRRTFWSAAQFGLGNVIAAVLAIYWTLALPQELTLERFADWRLFILYGSFVGALHGGSLDALLYRWSRRRSRRLAPGLLGVLTVLTAWHVGLLGFSIVLINLIHIPNSVRILITIVLVYAVVWNAITALQYAYQANAEFLRISIFIACHAGLFAAVVASGILTHTQRFHASDAFVTAALAAGVITLVWGSVWYSRSVGGLRRAASLTLLSIRSGAPILFVNLLLILLVNADRLGVSIGFSRSEFGVYAFAASILALVANFTSVGARFAVPHVARWVQSGVFEHRYRWVIWSIFCAWTLVLAMCTIMQFVIPRFFNAYTSAIPVLMIMALGIPFTASTQVLHLNYARSARRVHNSTISAIVTVAWALVVIGIAIFSRSLIGMAVAGVAVAGVWWLLGVLFVLPGSLPMKRTNVLFGLSAVLVGAIWLALYTAPVPIKVGGMGLCLMAFGVTAWRLGAAAHWVG